MIMINLRQNSVVVSMMNKIEEEEEEEDDDDYDYDKTPSEYRSSRYDEWVWSLRKHGSIPFTGQIYFLLPKFARPLQSPHT